MSKSVAGTEAPVATSEVFTRDVMLAWYRGEFAAANAIIDALCCHVAEIDGGSDYKAAFAAIHRRRMNWIPVIQMQRFYSISDVATELRLVADKAKESRLSNSAKEIVDHEERSSERSESVRVSIEGDEDQVTEGSSADCADHRIHPEICDDASRSVIEEDAYEITTWQIGLGSQGEQTACLENAMICSNHEECASRREKIKTCKGFSARESVKGHMVNVVKGLKVYEEIFTDSELLRLAEYINELRHAGHMGELSGETFIYFNKQMKGNKREIIQLGVPLFQSAKEDSTSNIEPIPLVLETVINHLVQWRLIPEGRRPNSCIINFFDEDEFSQPYFKPPHLDNPISTLVLSETTLAFGRVLPSDPNGNYKGSLTLPLKKGSLLVMRGNSADMAKHIICPSGNRRATITFVRVRPPNNQAMTLWQLGAKVPTSTGAVAYAAQAVVPSWGLALRTHPIFMFSPGKAIGGQGKRNGRGGTGVFLPWNVGPKKYTKHLPPRIQKRRLPLLPSPIEAM